MSAFDEFFDDDRSKDVSVLIEVTKKFLKFVTMMAEIVDELDVKVTDLGQKIAQLGQGGSPGISPPIGGQSAPPSPMSSPSAAPLPPMSASPPPMSANAPPPPGGGLPPPPGGGLPPPPSTGGLPPPPGAGGFSPPPSSGGFGGLTPAPQPRPPAGGGSPQGDFKSELRNALSSGGGLKPTPQTAPPGNRPPAAGGGISLKASLNSELKEAFAKIKKNWDEDDQ